MIRSESFPCIVCGKRLLRMMDDYEAQPSEGVTCNTRGNYGSTVFDPLNGERIYFNICDDCFILAGEQGRLSVTVEAVAITTTSKYGDRFIDSIVGWRSTDRPFTLWTKDLEPDTTRENMEIEEILEMFDNPQFTWNLKREGFEHILGELEQ